MAKDNTPHPLTEIEVVMRKQMTYEEFKKMLQQAKSKGWTVNSYQIGRASDGLGRKI